MSLLCVRGAQVVVSSGVTTTLATGFFKPRGVAVSPDGLNLFVTDWGPVYQVCIHVRGSVDL